MNNFAPLKPTRAQLEQARNKTVSDVIAPNLRILFCGINPGLYTAAVGHHFARPGNRFWPALHQSGFTPRLLRPHEENELLTWGYGVTNFVNRATATAEEIAPAEYPAGAARLEKKVRKFTPRYLAILGVGAYRLGFARPKAGTGLQPETIGQTRIWVLPNPSGLNAHYQAGDLARLFAELKRAADAG